jgi:hypothetical protein
VPPTFDTGTFLLYLSGITTNLLPQEQKDFSVLSSLPTEPLVSSYIILSDFDTLLFKNTSLPKSTSLIGL